MAILIKETFEVDAPIDVVWRFVMDPNKVAACMPGAKLEEVVDERTFNGSIKIKVGAITASYKGRVEMTTVDEANYTVEMFAEGREQSGGTAKGTMVSRLRDIDGKSSEIISEANVDLTGRIMQVGRGMIQGVSHQLFLKFVAAATKQLAADAGESGGTSEGTGAAPAAVAASAPPKDEALSVLPLLFKALWSAIVNFFRRLFGKK
jgi:carbon monoxide dehydrogenase subunit G